MILAALLLAAEPVLVAPSPFALRLVAKDDGFEVLLSNRSKTPQLYLLRADRQPLALYVPGCKVLDDRGAQPPEPVYFAHYKTLLPDLEIAVGHITHGGTPIDLWHIDLASQHCAYLPAGSYRVSAIMRAQIRECRDCTAAQRPLVEHMWQGLLRSNELAVAYKR